MEILGSTHLAVRTRNPGKIQTAIPNSKILKTEGDIHTVSVEWELRETQILSQLHVKNVPSPILRDYNWPGMHKPMHHQRTTAEFLSMHPRGFCFNEQGTGKTASAIWASDYLLTAGYIKRVLVICPLSVVQAAWCQDLFTFAIHRRVGIAHGSRDKRRDVISRDYEYVIINYDGVEIVAKEIADAKFDLIIIDEANAYKSTSTKRWKTMNKLVTDSTWLWLMTGTPASQSPADAYGLAKLCVPSNVPRFFTSFRESVMYNLTRFKWVPKPDAALRVHAVLQPAIRFEKKDCLDLPEVTHVDRYVPLTPQQQKYYDILRKEFLMQAGGEEITSANAAVNLNKLLQISGGAVYSNTGAVLEFDVANRLHVVGEVVAESSNKVLVFAMFTHTVNLLKTYLTNNNIPCAVIDGSVTATRRNDLIVQFQSRGAADLKVLVIQPAAAAHGITLTAADTIIWYGPCTSIEIYLQANARIDRKGQKNAMTIVHLSGSPVERRLYRMLRERLHDHVKLIDLYREEIST